MRGLRLVPGSLCFPGIPSREHYKHTTGKLESQCNQHFKKESMQISQTLPVSAYFLSIDFPLATHENFPMFICFPGDDERHIGRE